jgi:DNA repair protein RecO (recombination protein O)
VAPRTYKTEAVVLRSIRSAKPTALLHLYTSSEAASGRRGVRKTKSRFGGRPEPLSHVELMLHQGSGELQTVTGVDLIHHHKARATTTTG